MKIRIWILFLLIALISCRRPQNPLSQSDITADDLKFHVYYLASDSLEGRGTGTSGDSMAQAHIAEAFREYGLKPAGENGYFQYFEIVREVRADSADQLLRYGDRTFRFDLDYRPYVFSSTDSLSAHVVFAGYGIESQNPAYSDYASVDVRGKIVLLFRYGPDGDNPRSPFASHTPVRRKTALAAEKGAKAVLMTTGPLDGDDDLPSLRYDMTTDNYGIPVIAVTRQVAQSILGIDEKQLRQLNQSLRKRVKPKEILSSSEVLLKSHIRYLKAKTANVIAVFEGRDKERKDEYLVIGAHHDHLGWGGISSAFKGGPAIHNGADDNASGVASLLELAQKISTYRPVLRRSVLFIAFGAEETGLLGSKYFLEHPTVPKEQMIAMINLDMVGRMTDSQLIVYGTGTAGMFPELVREKNQSYNLKLTLRPEGDGPSDVAEFYRQRIPVLYFFTNVHDDYHKPTDDADKINYDGQSRITQLVFDIAHALASSDTAPVFTQVAADSVARPRAFGVTLGITPNMAESGQGLKVDAVKPGGSADKAGIQKGDIIIRFGNRTIKNIYDYTYALGDYKPGDKAEIIIKRGDKEIKVIAMMQASKRRE